MWVPIPPPIPTHQVLQNYENHIPLLLVIVTVTLYMTNGKDNGMEDIYSSEMGKSAFTTVQTQSNLLETKLQIELALHVTSSLQFDFYFKPPVEWSEKI